MTGNEQDIRSRADAEHLASRLVDVLDRQLALFRRLDALSRRQREIVGEGDTDRLLVVLGERQDVIDELERLGEQLRPIRRGWESVLDRFPEPRRDEVRERLDALAELASTITSRDEADRRVLEERRSGASNELASLGRARGAAGAYGAPTARPSPRFQDTEG